MAAVPISTLFPAPRLLAASEPSWLDTFTAWLDNPTVAFLLLAIGIASVMVEVSNPGIIGTGVGGVIAILLGLWSLSMQPVSTVGVVLVVLAAALFLVELLSPTMGVAAFLGSVALAVGGLLLVDDPVTGGVPAGVVLPTAAVIGGAVVLAGRLALRTRAQPSTLTGAARLVGRELTVDRVDADGSGHAFIEGAWWRVRTADQPLAPRAPTRIIAVDGLVLVVAGGGADPQRKDAP